MTVTLQGCGPQMPCTLGQLSHAPLGMQVQTGQHRLDLGITPGISAEVAPSVLYA